MGEKGTAVVKMAINGEETTLFSQDKKYSFKTVVFFGALKMSHALACPCDILFRRKSSSQTFFARRLLAFKRPSLYTGAKVAFKGSLFFLFFIQ